MKKKTEINQLPTSPALVGKDVYLRPAEPADYELTYRWFLASDPHSQTCHLIRMATPAQAAERAKQREINVNEGDFIIIRLEDDNPVGKIRYFNLNMLNRSAEVGIIMAPDARKQGYAKEGLSLLVGYLFAYLNLNKVYAQTSTFNKAAIKLLEALDFKLDGTLRQHHYFKGDLYDDLVYSLLKFEYSP
nr:GNAT family N-acetyltransferase [candidate division Zixibacteria bacterium]